MLSIGANTHGPDAHSGVHQRPISFVSSRQLSVQQSLSVPIHIDDLNEIIAEDVTVQGRAMYPRALCVPQADGVV